MAGVAPARCHRITKSGQHKASESAPPPRGAAFGRSTYRLIQPGRLHEKALFVLELYTK